MNMMKRNVYKLINGKAASCCIDVNCWLIGLIKNICDKCGVQFKVDESTIDCTSQEVAAVFAADNEEDYIDAACWLRNELGVELP